jgi:dihydrofolate reductase
MPVTSGDATRRVRVTTMVKLVYAAITSLDGCSADENGTFDWAAPNPEVFAFINDLERDVGTYLYGRRMYETMVYWETFEATDDDSEIERDFSDIWKSADKVVYSTTLETTSSSKTWIERTFDPEAVRRMKSSAERDITVAGANLAQQAMAAGLIDEIHLFLKPVTVGGGTSAIPHPFFSNTELLAMDRFSDGFVHLHYRMTI